MKNKIIVLVVVVVVLAAGAIFIKRNSGNTDSVKEKQNSVMKNENSNTMTEDKMATDESMPKKDSSVSKEENTMSKESSGTYVDYTSQLLDGAQKMQVDGRKVVLFFHAPWCPYCKAADQDFKSAISSGNFPSNITLIKVDYDSQTELKKKYGVTTQHTFVQVDSTGNQITKWISGETSDLATKVK